jgi:hypothetical protein
MTDHSASTNRLEEILVNQYLWDEKIDCKDCKHSYIGEREIGLSCKLSRAIGYVAPNVFVPDLDSDLAKAGAETAKALKDAGYLGFNVFGPGRMA